MRIATIIFLIFAAAILAEEKPYKCTYYQKSGSGTLCKVYSVRVVLGQSTSNGDLTE